MAPSSSRGALRQRRGAERRIDERNTWNESCLTFSYLNDTVPPAGTFTGVVVYTLSTP